VLRLQRGTVGQFVHLAVQTRGLPLQPEIQLGCSEFVAQEVQHLGRVLDLPLLVVELLHRLVAAPMRTLDLEFHLLDLDRQH
jgi:hypothetical protein